jgi:succinate dehydrogenase / fumarate reductase membrane anchor subunit
MSDNFGYKRTVVGAHYGLRDWLSQRVTAVLMALFTLILLVQLVLTKGPIGYDRWASIFSSQWMKVLTFCVILALIWHAWVGMRNIWMDYIKPVACAWCCRFSPSSGWSAVLAGVSRFCGVSD